MHRAPDDHWEPTLWGLCALALGVVCVVWGMTVALQPRVAVLDHTSWMFFGDVSEMRTVTEGGWELPADAHVLQSVAKQRFIRSVVDHIETVCREVTVPLQTLSHYETRCTTTVVELTPELEVYSHTEEVCYASGHCEEQDVYDKVPSTPVYQEVCEQVPVYATELVLEEECSETRVMRDEPVIETYWTFTIKRWVPSRKVRYDSMDGDSLDMIDLADPNARYSYSGWMFYLYFDHNATKVKTTREIYDHYKHLLGQEVDVPSH